MFHLNRIRVSAIIGQIFTGKFDNKLNELRSERNFRRKSNFCSREMVELSLINCVLRYQVLFQLPGLVEIPRLEVKNQKII